MKNKITAWFTFFRLPNLPTAPGDAIAGAAICLAITQPLSTLVIEPETMLKLLAAGAAALLLYMFGLADNDIVGAEEDKTHAPKRPIPAGHISIAQAKVARAVCLGLAVAGAAFCRMPPAWWCVSAFLVAGILLYNRFKSKWPVFGLLAMGLCRGLSLFAGAAAMSGVTPSKALLLSEGSAESATSFIMVPTFLSPAVLLAVLGWTAYISAVTWIAAKEHEAHDPLPWHRFLPGLTVFIPMAALAAYPRHSWPLIIVCSLCAYGIWLLSVLPLGRPHTPDIRRRAVGNAIGAIIYLQAAYILAFPHINLIGIVIAIFISTAFIRKFLESVQGS